MSRRLGISIKINALVVALVLLTAAVSAIFMARTQLANDHTRLLEKSRVLASMLADNVEYEVFADDTRALRRRVQMLAADRDTTLAAVWDAAGRPLAVVPFAPDGVRPERAGRPAETAAPAVWTSAARVVARRVDDGAEAVAPILSRAAGDGDDMLMDDLSGDGRDVRVIGHVLVRLSDASTRRRFAETIPAIAAVSLLLLLSASLASLLITRRLVAPLAKLSAAAAAVGRERLDVDLQVAASDEISELAASFREMVARIRDYRERDRQMVQLADAANRAKSAFLAVMSHELRTPLNSIIGFSEVLADPAFGTLSDEQRGYVADIHDSGRHLLALINDILDVSKIEAGKMELALETADVGSVIAAVLHMVRERSLRQHVALQVEVDPALPQVRVDSRKLKQILLNLVSNAVKFTHAGGTVRIAAGRVERARIDADIPPAFARGEAGLPVDAPAYLEIRVEDTGIGIPEASLLAVFEPFTQLEATLSRAQGGTGLGLALTRRLVEMHGGVLWLRSREGQGSVFTFVLPMPREEGEDPAPTDGQPSTRAEG